MQTSSFTGRVAFVTGASRGIGKAIALKLASAGAKVIGTATSEKGAQAITEMLPEGSYGVVLNVADEKNILDVVNNVAEKEGKIDILVNNAGITRDMLSMRLSDEAWQEVIHTNLTGAFRVIRAALRGMMKARFGRIVNISSVVGVIGNAGQANYAAAKAGLIAMSRSIAREVASRGITVNCVAPGFIETDMTKDLPEEIKTTLLNEIPMKTLGSAEDIAGAVLFLTDPETRYVTGTVLHVNGGLFMG